MSNNYTITVKEQGTGNIISGATVSFYNWNPYNQIVTTKTTASNGKAYMLIFSSTTLDLVVSKEGYETNVTRNADTSSPAPMDVYLNKSAVVTGEIKLVGGDSVEDINAHMYNVDTNFKMAKRVIVPVDQGSWLSSSTPIQPTGCSSWKARTPTRS